MQYLYLICSGESHKIGVANDPRSRIKELQTGNPVSLQMVYCFGFQNAFSVEQSIHQRFSEKRVSGEWFSLSEDEIQAFVSLCFMLGGQPYIVTTQVIESVDMEKEMRNLDPRSTIIVVAAALIVATFLALFMVIFKAV
jgi:hypothetical protein